MICQLMRHHLTTSPCCYQGCFGHMRQNRQTYMQCRSSLRRVWINTGRRLRQKKWRFSFLSSSCLVSIICQKPACTGHLIPSCVCLPLQTWFPKTGLKSSASTSIWMTARRLQPKVTQTTTPSSRCGPFWSRCGAAVTVTPTIIQESTSPSMKQWLNSTVASASNRTSEVCIELVIAWQSLCSLLDYLFLLPNRGCAGGYDTHIKCNDTCLWKNIVYLHLF